MERNALPNVYFEDLGVGSVHLGRKCLCDRNEMLEYARLNDPWPFHIDDSAALSLGFGRVIASGGYIITLWYRSLIGIYNTPTSTWAFLGGFDWKIKFLAPVRAGDTLQARLTIKEKRPSSKPGRGVVQSYHELLNQQSNVVFTVATVVLLATRPNRPQIRHTE